MLGRRRFCIKDYKNASISLILSLWKNCVGCKLSQIFPTVPRTMMNVHPRSISPQDSPIPESPTSSEASSILGTDSAVIFESYLYKIPPLKKSILMKWSKRLFTLRRSDMSDPATIELCYTKDSSNKGKKHVIDLSSIVGIRPTPKVGSTDNIFAIETKERKYVLKAADIHIKNIWLAKLCEYCGQEPVYHITVPHQAPVLAYNEAILKLSCDSNVSIVLPSTSETLLSIQYGDIRRMGYTDVYNSDIVWFETCKNSQADRFFFFVVPSGIEVSRQIVQDLKASIQAYKSSLLILEDSSSMDMSYISREHYGCTEYSMESRSQILHAGLYRLPSPAYRFFVPCERSRRESVPAPNNTQQDGNQGGVSLEEFGRRKSKSQKGPSTPLTRRPTLDKFVRQSSFDRQASTSSFDRQTSVSSFDRSIPGTPSLDREFTSPSIPELSDSHFSSGSASDVFDSPTVPHRHIQRKLSVQSSTSSQSSSNSSISPTIIEEEATLGDAFSFEPVPGTRSFSCSGISVPTVPPRSIVSLQDVTAH